MAGSEEERRRLGSFGVLFRCLVELIAQGSGAGGGLEMGETWVVRGKGGEARGERKRSEWIVKHLLEVRFIFEDSQGGLIR